MNEEEFNKIILSATMIEKCHDGANQVHVDLRHYYSGLYLSKFSPWNDSPNDYFNRIVQQKTSNTLYGFRSNFITTIKRDYPETRNYKYYLGKEPKLNRSERVQTFFENNNNRMRTIGILGAASGILLTSSAIFLYVGLLFPQLALPFFIIASAVFCSGLLLGGIALCMPMGLITADQQDLSFN